MSELTVIVTTFLRPELLVRSVERTLTVIPHGWTVLIGDQTHTKATEEALESLEAHYKRTVNYIPLEYDCGLSKARNTLASMCNGPVLMSQDSIAVINPTAIKSAMGLLGAYDLIGFNLARGSGEIMRWCGNMQNGTLVMSPPYHPIMPVDICYNYFICDAKLLKKYPYDERLKLCEHGTFFQQLKTAGKRVANYEAAAGLKLDWDMGIQCEYNRLRKREWQEFRKLAQELHGANIFF
jgi:hypothetical protein